MGNAPLQIIIIRIHTSRKIIRIVALTYRGRWLPLVWLHPPLRPKPGAVAKGGTDGAWASKRQPQTTETKRKARRKRLAEAPNRSNPLTRSHPRCMQHLRQTYARKRSCRPRGRVSVLGSANCTQSRAERGARLLVPAVHRWRTLPRSIVWQMQRSQHRSVFLYLYKHYATSPNHGKQHSIYTAIMQKDCMLS